LPGIGPAQPAQSSQAAAANSRKAPWGSGRISTVPPGTEDHGAHRSAAFRLQKRAKHHRRHRTNFNALTIPAFLQPKGRAPMRRWSCRNAPMVGTGLAGGDVFVRSENVRAGKLAGLYGPFG